MTVLRLQPKQGERLADLAPTSKELLQMAELSIAESHSARPSNINSLADTFVFPDNPWDDLDRQDGR